MFPFGVTRTRVQRDHALLCPDSHVAAPLPGATGTVRATVLISPQMGSAQFIQYFADLGPDSALPPAPPHRERFLLVLSGTLTVTLADSEPEQLESGGYAYLPAHQLATIGTEASNSTTRVLVFEKRYQAGADELPSPIIGNEQSVAGVPFLGDPAARLQVLLPDIPSFDMAVNIFTYDPGATLPMVESHVMEHGLLMLSGSGVYRLSDSWYPVQAGDVIWMAPYCPQWFVAMGKEPARYLYYKNVNRDPLEEA